MAPTLSTLELDILRKLVNGEAVSLSSHLRLRLEMAGVLRDGARGIVVTEAGKRLALQRPADVAAGPPCRHGVAAPPISRRPPDGWVDG